MTSALVSQVGDHIEKIDSESLVGCRHYEVAKIFGRMPGIEPELLRPQPGVLSMSYTHPSYISNFAFFAFYVLTFFYFLGLFILFVFLFSCFLVFLFYCFLLLLFCVFLYLLFLCLLSILFFFDFCASLPYLLLC